MTLTVPQPQEVEPTVELGSFKFSKAGMQVNGEPTFSEWEDVVGRLNFVNEYSTFWLAHLLSFGEHKWGEMYSQAMEATHMSYSYLANNVHTVRTIPPEDWRLPEITFEGHRLLASIQDRDERNKLRDEAITEGWTTPTLRRQIEASKGKIMPWNGEGTVVKPDDAEAIQFYPSVGTDRSQIPDGYCAATLRRIDA